MVITATRKGPQMLRRTTVKQRLYRLLGVVRLSSSYPLPPRWALSRKGQRDTLYPGLVIVAGDRSVAVDGGVCFTCTGCGRRNVPVRPASFRQGPSGAATPLAGRCPDDHFTARR
jgi:hypothetical protein